MRCVNISAMKRLLALLVLLGCSAALLPGAEERTLAPMPVAVSGNAVASLREGLDLFSMMGVGPRKTWDDVTSKFFVLHLASGKWYEGHPVPGVIGRVNAAAASAKGREIVLMGGFVVDASGAERPVADVNVYEPTIREWSRAQDLPIAVDSAVVGVHDRFVYLTGGRSSSGPVNNVQVYDVEKDSWSSATPFPGTPAFGQAGGVADEDIVIIDGAKPGPAGGPRYVASSECWLGKIDHKHPDKIEWSKLPPHPGPARFGIASGGSDHYKRVYFSGGTSTPHDFKGVSYDGKPPEVSAFTFAYDVHSHKWETLSDNTFDPRGDGRGILISPYGPVVIGGMNENLAVTSRVTLLPRKEGTFGK
jgi:N-acetylneuraminic acid mutarotase